MLNWHGWWTFGNVSSGPWCDLQIDLSTWLDVLSSLGCHAQILLECSLWHWSKLPNSLSYFLTFENKFSIKHLTRCRTMHMMHAWYKRYGMICHAQKCLINHVLFPNYAQWSFEDKRQKGKHLSNLSPHPFFLQIFSSSHTISIILYSHKYFFVKTSSSFFFYHFQHGIIFNSFFIPNMSVFFQIAQKYIFFEEEDE